MNCLLDTHTFLWAAMDPEKLSRRARVTILDAANDIHVSVVTFWEVSLKFALGKIALQGTTPEDLPDVEDTWVLLSLLWRRKTLPPSINCRDSSTKTRLTACWSGNPSASI